jgi:hypothetical protein
MDRHCLLHSTSSIVMRLGRQPLENEDTQLAARLWLSQAAVAVPLQVNPRRHTLLGSPEEAAVS